MTADRCCAWQTALCWLAVMPIPLLAGLISEEAILGDLFEICQSSAVLRRLEDITLYKNSGGAHLDLTVCQYVMQCLASKAS